MRCDEPYAGAAGAGARETLKCNSKDEYIGQVDDDVMAMATESNRTVRRWVQDARASLRGRPLFALFTVVNLVNYMDRGVRGVLSVLVVIDS